MFNAGYANNARLDLVDDILRCEPTSVVEFGAYDGATLSALSYIFPNCDYTAVDYDEDALEMVNSSGINVICDDLNEPVSSKYRETFNDDEKCVILLLDVIEHLHSPEKFLDWLIEITPSDTIVFISVPNIASWRTFYRLILNDWPQHSSGIFDQTHLHQFTAKSIKARFEKYGEIQSLSYRRSDKIFFRLLQNFFPRLLCGQITLMMKIYFVKRRDGNDKIGYTNIARLDR